MPADEKKKSATTEMVDESALLRFEQSPGFPRDLYSNYVTAHTALDMSVTFGETAGAPDKDGKGVVNKSSRE